LVEDQSSLRTSNRDRTENPNQGKATVRHHVVEIRNTEPLACVGEQVVILILWDRGNEQNTDHTGTQQSEQDRYTWPERQVGEVVYARQLLSSRSSVSRLYSENIRQYS
jgi:hypothetical protein